jgi:hypothetical protein
VIEAIIETAKRASSSMNTLGALCYGIMTCVAMAIPTTRFPRTLFVPIVRRGVSSRASSDSPTDAVAKEIILSQKYLVWTRCRLLQSRWSGRNNIRGKGFVAGARELICGGWLAWFDGSSVRECGARSMMIQVFLSHPKSSAG